MITYNGSSPPIVNWFRAVRGATLCRWAGLRSTTGCGQLHRCWGHGETRQLPGARVRPNLDLVMCPLCGGVNSQHCYRCRT